MFTQILKSTTLSYDVMCCSIGSRKDQKQPEKKGDFDKVKGGSNMTGIICV